MKNMLISNEIFKRLEIKPLESITAFNVFIDTIKVSRHFFLKLLPFILFVSISAFIIDISLSRNIQLTFNSNAFSHLPYFLFWTIVSAFSFIIIALHILVYSENSSKKSYRAAFSRSASYILSVSLLNILIYFIIPYPILALYKFILVSSMPIASAIIDWASQFSALLYFTIVNVFPLIFISIMVCTFGFILATFIIKTFLSIPICLFENENIYRSLKGSINRTKNRCRLIAKLMTYYLIMPVIFYAVIEWLVFYFINPSGFLFIIFTFFQLLLLTMIVFFENIGGIIVYWRITFDEQGTSINS